MGACASLVASATWCCDCATPITACPPACHSSQSFVSLPLQFTAGFESHNAAVNSDKTKLSFALQLAAASAGDSGERSSAARGAASTAGGGQGGVMPATVWRSGMEWVLAGAYPLGPV